LGFLVPFFALFFHDVSIFLQAELRSFSIGPIRCNLVNKRFRLSPFLFSLDSFLTYSFFQEGLSSIGGDFFLLFLYPLVSFPFEIPLNPWFPVSTVWKLPCVFLS